MDNKVKENIKNTPIVEHKVIEKENVIMSLSEWSDFEVLANRIKQKYGATLKNKDNNGATFEGKKFVVELKKI